MKFRKGYWWWCSTPGQVYFWRIQISYFHKHTRLTSWPYDHFAHLLICTHQFYFFKHNLSRRIQISHFYSSHMTKPPCSVGAPLWFKGPYVQQKIGGITCLSHHWNCFPPQSVAKKIRQLFWFVTKRNIAFDISKNFGIVEQGTEHHQHMECSTHSYRYCREASKTLLTPYMSVPN